MDIAGCHYGPPLPMRYANDDDETCNYVIFLVDSYLMPTASLWCICTSACLHAVFLVHGRHSAYTWPLWPVPGLY